MLEKNKIHLGDCLDLMPLISDRSVDMVLCDLPYGSTACKWDSIIPFAPLWKEYKRIIKDNGAIVLTARNPFSSALLMSNPKMYKHKWVWNKKQSGSFFNAKYMPLQIEEDILVFANGKVNYYPIMRKGKMRYKGGQAKTTRWVKGLEINERYYSDEYYPVNIIEYPNCKNKSANIHPTQKNWELFEYLIKTYTLEGETVLDNCIGSGTTAIACMNANRNFIGIEKDETFFQLANERIAKFGGEKNKTF